MFSYSDMLILASNMDDCTTTEDEGTVDDREACPGCGCKPGEGYTHGCQACRETQDTLAGGHDSGEDEGADEEGDETMTTLNANVYRKHLRTVEMNGKNLLAELHHMGHEEVTYFARYTAAQLVAEDLARNGVPASVSKRFAGYVVVIK